MIYTSEQLFDLIAPMIATISGKDLNSSEVIAATTAIVKLSQDNSQAILNDYANKKIDDIRRVQG